MRDPLTLLGVPYVLGSCDPAIGFDCWTLVDYVRKECFGVSTPLSVNLCDGPRIQPSERPLSGVNRVAVKHAQRLIENAQRTGAWRRIDAPGFPGCVVGMSLSSRMALHHVGIALAPGVLHAWGGATAGRVGSVILTPWERLRPLFADVEVYECRA